MTNLTIITSAFILLSGCGSKSLNDNTSNKTAESVMPVFERDTVINLYSASFVSPKGWRWINDDTLPKTNDATARYRLQNKNGKIIYIEHGLGASKRYEPYTIPANLRASYIKNGVDTTGLLFSDDKRLGEIRKQYNYNVVLGKISNYNARIYEPVRAGGGYSGVFIDSVGEVAGNITGFSMFAKDLDSIENAELKRVIRTLSLKPFN